MKASELIPSFLDENLLRAYVFISCNNTVVLHILIILYKCNILVKLSCLSNKLRYKREKCFLKPMQASLGTPMVAVLKTLCKSCEGILAILH